MRAFRIISGIGLLFSSVVVAGFVATTTGIDSVGGVALSSLIAFFAGTWFRSGFSRRGL